MTIATASNPQVKPSVRPAGPCATVIFGAAGDLTKRLLMPALYNLAHSKLLPQEFAIVGVAHTQVSQDHLSSQTESRHPGVCHGSGRRPAMAAI